MLLPGKLWARYYYDATYADGSDRTLARSDSAEERALALDPNLIFAGGTLATNRADEGNKRDVKKKVLPRPEGEKIFVSRSSPLHCKSASRFCARGFAFELSSIPIGFMVRW